ncbi:MAG: sigma-70 family RNA polymerase sigma factor [Kiritimatiellae bacterium]|nr:sigma-70 family RNA polymerase sigma factor [Kiritimatiellia bacterium]
MSDDATLLADYARKGDVTALSALITRHAAWLMALLRGLSPTTADVEDAFQETWVRVMKSAAAFRGGSVRAYLARVARSVAVDRFRRVHMQEVSLDAAGDDGQTLGEVMADEGPTPVEAFESKATREDVRAAVQSLPEGPREVLLMRVEGELAFHEIAAALGVPLGTVLTWMRAATVQLKKKLGNGND